MGDIECTAPYIYRIRSLVRYHLTLYEHLYEYHWLKMTALRLHMGWVRVVLFNTCQYTFPYKNNTALKINLKPFPRSTEEIN